MSGTDRTTVTRRRALQTGSLAAIAAGLLGAATTLPAAAAPVHPLDEAETLLHRIEALLLELDGSGRCDVGVELERLSRIAEAAVVQAYVEPKAAMIARYGEVGELAWVKAWTRALFGHCEDCREAA